MPNSLDITAINVRDRKALASDDTLCTITQLLDLDGDETEDEETSLVAVIRYNDDNWFTVKLSDFAKAMN